VNADFSVQTILKVSNPQILNRLQPTLALHPRALNDLHHPIHPIHMLEVKVEVAAECTSEARVSHIQLFYDALLLTLWQNQQLPTP
jgi:hypothetical protein